MRRPELLSPAGTLKNMRYAAAYGADAVYAGQPRYSLRVRNNEFNLENLAQGINELHAQNKKLYVVSNIQPHNAKLKTFVKDLGEVINLKPDAIIMSDPGMIMLARENYPDMPLHLSVQANTINYAAVKFWEKQGIKRIILSRELSLAEIEQIRQECPDIELEVFIHGALCMAYSGRCLLSGYLNHRDSNQGACTNSCRWEYKIRKAMEDDCGELQLFEPNLGTDMITPHSFMLEEAKRPGEFMPCDEDEHGTYIMNSKDLRALEHVRKLCEIGVDSLKIEGRTKSFYYCARTASVYRRAIDDVMNNTDHLEEQLKELESLAHRGYTDGFLARHPISKYQNYDYGYSISDKSQFVGEVLGVTDDGLWEVAVRNRFELNDKIEILTPKGSTVITLDNLMNKKRENIEIAPGDGHIVYFKSPLDNTEADKAIIVRKFQSGETTRNTVVEK
ncbi:MAG: tRNA 5-hydroxyuridine modification protein YegQ [Ruminobacter sp.]|jgi:putative protease|nr:tRNA 5-hydroxyuridine modification protein YegQ [Ruminobacter sp.]